MGFEKEIEAQFTLRAPEFERSARWIADPGLLAAHAALAHPAPEGRLLEICCGTGVVGASFRGKFGRLVGVDLTPEMLARARRRLDECVRASVYELPFPAASCAAAVLREALHLMESPSGALAEAFRVLRPGGQMIVSHIVPYGGGDAEWMRRVFLKKQPLARHFFSVEDLEALLRQAGFSVIGVTDYLLEESIQRWVDTHETPPPVREEIYKLYRDASPELRRVRAIRMEPDGTIFDRWRWVLLSGIKKS